MRVDDDRLPYTYLIGWTKLDLWYYGSRWAKNCHPDDLWVKYFTSSNNVKRLRDIHGEPDVIEITDTFRTREEAKEWETIIIKLYGIVQSKNWLNICSPDKQFQCIGGWKLSKENCELKSKRMSGEGNPMFGKRPSPETLEKQRLKKLGRKVTFSEAAIQNIRNGIRTRIRIFTDEEKQHRSTLFRNNNPMMNEQSRQRVSESKIGRFWVTDGEKSMCIHKDSTIPEGFKRGRK